LATAGLAGAQEATPGTAEKPTQSQAKKGDASGQGQAQGVRNETGATRKLGPGDGTGNQGIKPQDGTGNGSPGQTGASNGKTQAKKQGKAAKSGKRNSGSSGSGRGTLSRSRARNLSGSGNGNCTGSGAGSRRGSAGSRGSGGGRR
jgi:hypothetical protein